MHISSSSQSSIAALKDVLAYGRLTNSPPLSPPSPSGAVPTTPIPYPYTYWGGLWVKPEGVGGGGEREQSSSISRFLGNSGALSALKQIVHILSYLERLFHSVNSNSVVYSHFICHNCCVGGPILIWLRLHPCYRLRFILKKKVQIQTYPYQGCGSGSTWIRIHFPSWIRIRIQEGKYVNKKLKKCKEIANNCNFIKFFKCKFAQAPFRIQVQV